ncbi:MAG: DUF5989 family protein [Verrucomicrobiota bacterium]|jgi:hypothetical protein|nr:DUF5989 family protein [Verrucomicrobiota bacterium]
MRFFRHFKRLMGDLFGFAKHNKVWWIIPLVVLLLLVAAVIVVSQGTAPFIYTLF